MPTDVTYHFSDGPGNTASGVQVSQNFTDALAAVDNVAGAVGVPVPVTNAKMRGVSNIAASGTRTNAAFGALNNGPDQVTGLVVPSQDSILRIRYMAMWASSGANAASAAIFIGSNQAVIGQSGAAANVIQAAINDGGPNIVTPLATGPGGLMGQGATVPAVNYGGYATTGQIIGNAVYTAAITGASAGTLGREPIGGPFEIFNLPAGTYTVSVQFLCGAAGTVTVSNRRLWAEVVGF